MAIPDDVIYGGLLVLSIPFGLIIRRAEDAQKKQLISTVTGLFIALFVCGLHSLHSLITVLVNTAIIFVVGPK